MGYQVEVAYDVDFSRVIATVPTDTNAFLTQSVQEIDGHSTCYWRVRAMVPNTPSAYSEVRSFRGRLFSVVYPQDGESGVSVAPTIQWDDAVKGAEYHVQIATAATFADKEIVFSATTHDNQVSIPEDILTYGANYYVRVRILTGYIDVTSTPNLFTTEEVVMVPPTVLTPAMDAVVGGDSVLVSWSNTPNKGFRLEWANSSSFPNRGKKVKSVDMGTYQCRIGGLSQGTWYLRVATIRVDDSWTDYSDVILFTYDPAAGIGDVFVIDAASPCYDLQGRLVGERQSGHIYIQNGKLIYQQ